MKTRTDIHSPSHIMPENYSYEGTVYLGADEWASGLNETTAHTALATHGWQAGNFAAKGTCDHCGAWFLYGAVFTHAPTGDAICVGHICAAETFGASSRAELDLKRMKTAVATARERARIAGEVVDFLGQNEGLAGMLNCEHYIVQDIKNKLHRYGSISERQIALVEKLAKEAIERDEKKAAQALEPTVPVVTGKAITVTGIIVSTKMQDTQFGSTLKMVVKDDRGFRVWGTVPANIEGHDDNSELRGIRIAFVCNVEASKDDESFGFFKRPRKCTMIEAAAA